MANTVSYTGIEGTIIRETERAVLFSVVSISGNPISKPHENWFPISRMIKKFRNPNEKGKDTMMIESWLIDRFCEDHGL